MHKHRHRQLPVASPRVLASRTRSGGPVFLALSILLAGACTSDGQERAIQRPTTTRPAVGEEALGGESQHASTTDSSLRTTTSFGAHRSIRPAARPGVTQSLQPAEATAAPTPGACPSPKTCGEFAILQGRGWRPDSAGEVHIRYYINPRVPIGASYSSSEIIGAIQAAAATWQRANPRIRFEYQGTTDREAVQGDGYSVFFMGLNMVEYRVDGYIVEADIWPIATADEDDSWAPCDERSGDGGCAPVEFFEIQNILTHEIGHALGLDHVSNADDQFVNLTMSPGQTRDHLASRWRSTLGLGDILGVRHMYPCPGCPFPPIVEP